MIRHNLDVMHIEKNICDSVVGTLLDIEKSKDGLVARADLEVLNIRRSQHPRREGNRTLLFLVSLMDDNISISYNFL